MTFKSVLTPEGSIVAGLATVGLVAAIYQLDIGGVAQVQMSPTYDTSITTSVRKAGYTSLIAVAGLSLLARDPNIAILGGAAVIAMAAHYRHAYMTHPETGQLVPPGPQAYQPAQSVVPPALQGPNA